MCQSSLDFVRFGQQFSSADKRIVNTIMKLYMERDKTLVELIKYLRYSRLLLRSEEFNAISLTERNSRQLLSDMSPLGGRTCQMNGAPASYKRVNPYLWTELAPVLEGSGSRRRHPRQGRLRASTVFVSYWLHVSIVGLFTPRQKRIRGGSTFVKGNSGPLERHILPARTPHCLSVKHH